MVEAELALLILVTEAGLACLHSMLQQQHHAGPKLVALAVVRKYFGCFV